MWSCNYIENLLTKIDTFVNSISQIEEDLTKSIERLKLRSVEVILGEYENKDSEYQKKAGIPKREIKITGRFHGWHHNYCDIGDTSTTSLTAIVEKEDGSIITVPHEIIRFLS